MSGHIEATVDLMAANGNLIKAVEDAENAFALRFLSIDLTDEEEAALNALNDALEAAKAV